MNLQVIKVNRSPVSSVFGYYTGGPKGPIVWFVNYNFGHGWALASAPLNTANWDAEEGQQWTVPMGIGISKTTAFNGRPMSLGVQYYYNVKRPDSVAATQLRFVVALLYPIAKK
jgi:hypothetical protein